jgi:CRISPR-associated protein Cas5d
LEFAIRLWGRHAMYTDPISKLGGEKCSYPLPTHEAMKGVYKSICWKPTYIWYIDKLRILKLIETQTKGTKPMNWAGVGSKRNNLSIYNYLYDVEYQIQGHLEWNFYRPDLEKDRDKRKHDNMIKRWLKNGGRQDVFLGTRDCQAYAEPCEFGSGPGAYDNIETLTFGLMFHSFSYPDETGVNELHAQFWRPVLKYGVLEFPRPEECTIRRFIRPMQPKKFKFNVNLQALENEEEEL